MWWTCTHACQITQPQHRSYRLQLSYHIKDTIDAVNFLSVALDQTQLFSCADKCLSYYMGCCVILDDVMRVS